MDYEAIYWIIKPAQVISFFCLYLVGIGFSEISTETIRFT
jgi:hypothetical protein